MANLDPLVDWYHFKLKCWLVSSCFCCVCCLDRDSSHSVFYMQSLPRGILDPGQSGNITTEWIFSSWLSVFFRELSKVFLYHPSPSFTKLVTKTYWTTGLWYVPSLTPNRMYPFPPAFHICTPFCTALFVSFRTRFLSSFAFVFIHCQRKAFSWRLGI